MMNAQVPAEIRGSVELSLIEREARSQGRHRFSWGIADPLRSLMRRQVRVRETELRQRATTRYFLLNGWGL